MDSIIFSNETMNGVLVEIGSTHATAKRINLPKDSYWFSVLYESCKTIGFDFGCDRGIILICSPIISNDSNNEALLSSAMLPYEAGEFVMIFSILEQGAEHIVAKNLDLKDYLRIKKELRVRRDNKYLPTVWEK